ncbi:MAG: hypothetical protein HUU46_12805 [Candidatus Hydrogenedentes bacterium]|nr:hypothetical protein [Candidatus Hydrogenedentota bacterium]
MSPSPTLRLRIPGKRQRWPFVLAALVVVLVAGLQAAKYLIDADKYRPFLIERITKNTGLPATVERMDFAVFPVPALQARNITVGEGDFRATCSELNAYPNLASLLRGVIDINRLDIESLAATLPAKPGDLKARIDAMLQAHSEHVTSGTKVDSGVKLAIGRIEAPGAAITMHGSELPVFSGNLAATNVLSDTIDIIADAKSPAYGEDSRVAGTITLKRNAPAEIGLGVHGELDLTNVDTATLFKASRVPRAIATVHAVIERTAASQVKIALDGAANPVPVEGFDLSAIAGAFTGVAWWDTGQITINELNWKAPGLQFVSDITIEPDGAIATRVKEATANRDGVQAFLAAQPSANYRISPAESAQASAKDLLIGMTADKKLRLAAGTGSFSGVDLTLPKGQRAIAGFAGEVAFENDAVKIVALKAEDLSITGTVKPNFGEGTAAVELQGAVKLTRERLGMVMPLDAIKDAKGSIALDRVTGTFSSGGGVPEDLSIAGKLSGGSLAIDTPSWTDQFADAHAEFKATPGKIDTTATATSRKLGSVSVSGVYTIAKRTWSGSARGNLANMDLPFLKQEAAKKVAPGIVAAYGESKFGVDLSLPTEKDPLIHVNFERSGDPRLAGAVAMRNAKSGWELGDVSIDASIPGDALQPMMPEGVRADGNVPVIFKRDAAKGVFDATVNVDDANVALSDYLTKRAGTSASIEIHGVATTGNWAAKQIQIVCLDQTIDGRFTESRFEIPQFDVSAGALAALMPEGTKAGGRIRGKAATQPLEANIMLDNVNFALSDALGMDNLNGAVAYNDGGISCNDLSVRGADSDFTLDMVSRDGKWSGALTGKRLNVNELLEMKAKFQESSLVSNTAATGSASPNSGFTGKFDVNMANVVYRKAQLSNMFTNVTALNGDIELGNLTLASHGGATSGWIRVMQPRGERPASTTMSLKLDGVDLAIIDDIALEESRGVKGATSGQVDLELFTGETIPPFSGANGAVRLRSTDGTFGKVGMATKVLSVLRTLEITRLRAPKLKDQGLSFDTCESQATFTNGVMQLQSLAMTTPSYNITAFGMIDFNNQNSEVLVHVDILETVLGAADLVPGLDALVGQVRSAGGVRILLTGPPTDPNVSYGFGSKTNAITGEVRDTVKSTGNIVRDEIINRAADALRGILTNP